MVTVSPGATMYIDSSRVSELSDANGQPLKFEQKEKTNTFEAKGTDGNVYAFNKDNALLVVSAYAAVQDNKQLRKLNPGLPLPKEEGKKIDEELKKENEQRQELAKRGTTPEAEAMQKRAYQGGEIGQPQPQTAQTHKATTESNKTNDTRSRLRS